MEAARSLEKFIAYGQVNFKEVMKVPVKDRVPGLMKVYGEEKIHALMVVMLTDFANSYNVVRPMSPNQIITCAYKMLVTSNEDQLGIEDFSLFFQGAKEGKYGRVLDHIDQHVIFEMLENYRETRHKELVLFREEQHSQFKTSLVDERYVSETQNEDDNKFRKAMGDYMKKQWEEEQQNRA